MKKLAYLLLMALAMTGCKKATVLSSDVAEMTIPVEGQCDTITLHSDVNAFKLDSVPEWAKTELNDSILIVTVGKNDTGAARMGNLVVKNGDLSVAIKLFQPIKATRLELPEGDEIVIGKEGGEKSIAVDCDGMVAVEGFEGVTTNYKDGKLSVSAPANEGKSIKGTVKLTADEFSKDVKVKVEGAICDLCGGTGWKKCPTCGGSGIAVRYTAFGKTGGPCYTCGGPFGSNGKVKCTACKGKK